jgi:flagellar hook-length control protein FliK
MSVTTRSQATGMRPHAGGSEAASPFSELLESSEPPAADASEPASLPPEVAAPQADGKPASPNGRPESAPGKDVAKVQSQLVLSIVLPPGHATAHAEVPPVRTGLGVTLSQAISNKPTPASDPDSLLPAPDADADPADLAAVPQPAPALPDVPVPAPVPAGVAVPAQISAATETTVAAPIVELAPVATLTETAAAATKTEPTISIPTGAAVEAADAKTAAPLPEAAEAALSGLGSKEKTPHAEQLAGARTKAAADNNETARVSSKPAVDPEISSDPGVSPEAAEASAEKPSARAADASIVAKAARGVVETLDAKPQPAAAQPSPEIAANPSALPAPLVTHSGPQHAAQPSGHLAGPADAVPLPGLAVEIAAHAQSGKNRFEIRLDPPELGRIDVRLDVDNDGQVTSHLRVDRVETLDLLRRDAPALERALQQAGLKTSDSGLQFSLRDQSFSQQNQSRDMPAMARIVVPDETLLPAETQRNYGRLAGLGSGVDIRV